MRREFRFAISAAAVLVLAVFAVAPQSVWAAAPPVCLFRNALGLECYGCGMTRALSFAMHGDLEEALAMNGGVVVLLPVLVAAAATGLRR